MDVSRHYGKSDTFVILLAATILHFGLLSLLGLDTALRAYSTGARYSTNNCFTSLKSETLCPCQVHTELHRGVTERLKVLSTASTGGRSLCLPVGRQIPLRLLCV